jgi:hypothetical protein
MIICGDYGTQMTQMPLATQIFADFKNDFLIMLYSKKKSAKICVAKHLRHLRANANA